MPFSTKMWLENVCRKRLITSALRKDLLQIDGLDARISKLRYELYDLRKRIDLNYVALGVVMACKDQGQILELEEKEKWCVDEVKRLKAIVVTVVGTKTRLSTVEYKQWRSLRGRDYLSKQRMKRQVRGGLLIVSEIRETLRLFTRLVTERDMLHEKDYIAKITKAREDEDSMAFQRECRGDSTTVRNFTSREVSLEECKIPNCGMVLYLEVMVLLVQERDKERCSNKQNLRYCNMLTISQAAKDRERLS